VDAPPLVLIAERHEDTRLLMRTLFTMHGFAVAEADTLEAALTATARLEPQVVLLDAWLVKSDDGAFGQRLRSAGANRPAVVMLSTAHGPDVRRLALDLGCHGCLEKPVDIDELVALVRRLARGPEQGLAWAGAGEPSIL
jgi:two-component system KDP operon response regulator KdpE